MGKHGINDKIIITEDGKQAFLSTYQASFNMSKACDSIGWRLSTLSIARRDDPEFDSRVKETREAIADEFEEEMKRRAMSKSDLLLIFALKGLRPNVYQEKYQIIQKLEVSSAKDLSDADLEAIAKAKLVREAEDLTGKKPKEKDKETW